MRRGLQGVLRAAALLAAGPGAASGWQGFYTPSERETVGGGMEVSEDAVCVREILQAQLRHGIPGNLLLGIGLQEAGIQRDGRLTVWPWAVNAEGKGRLFESWKSAATWVEQQRAAGVSSIDVGCMQVNLHWHPEAFAEPAQGFDPAQNVDYAAQFLKELYRQTGDWETAAGSYHSFTPERRDTYLASLKRNLAVANDRIEAFRLLAAEARPRAEEETVRRAQAPGGIAWSSGLSQLQQGADGARSLYSDRALQPVLPVFLRTN